MNEQSPYQHCARRSKAKAIAIARRSNDAARMNWVFGSLVLLSLLLMGAGRLIGP